jgi:hypothetical protein
MHQGFKGNDCSWCVHSCMCGSAVVIRVAYIRSPHKCGILMFVHCVCLPYRAAGRLLHLQHCVLKLFTMTSVVFVCGSPLLLLLKPAGIFSHCHNCRPLPGPYSLCPQAYIQPPADYSWSRALGIDAAAVTLFLSLFTCFFL